MFGVIVSGRPVDTNFQPIGSNFVITIPDADNINHIVVFMTGQQPFPEGMGGLIYFSWPSPDGPPGWVLLGALSNLKPSCVFKVAGLKGTNSAAGAASFGQQMSHTAQIGISVELADVVQQNLSMLEEQKKGQEVRQVEFCRRMMENFFNYASSFALSQAQMVPNPSEVFVPLSVCQNWYQIFEKRFTLDPNFWQR